MRGHGTQFRLVLLLLPALALAACEDREEARARNELKLPPGCKIIDLDYGDLRAAVVCDGRPTTTSLRSWDVTQPVIITTGKTTTIVQETHHYVHLSAEIGPKVP